MKKSLDVAIVGGGLSGLYLANNLSTRGHRVTLYEKNERLGGRIHTIFGKGGLVYEVGAGRFSKNHKRFIKLIKLFGLQDSMKPINKERMYFKGSRRQNYDKLMNDTLFGKVLAKSKEYDDAYLCSLTLKDFMVDVIGVTATEDVINAFGYQSEFEVQNAYTSLKVFDHDFKDTIQYFYLQGGLEQLVEAMRKKLVTMGCKICTKTTVLDYVPSNKELTVSPESVVRYDKVVFCVTRNVLMGFKTLLHEDLKLSMFLKNSITTTPLLRTFAQFPPSKDGQIWFSGIPRFTSNLPLRYAIPMNPPKGLIQISYTDNEYAQKWHACSKTSLVEALMKDLKEIFPDKDIPRPLWVKRYYWEEGATYWKTGYRMYRNQSSRSYYMCGEMMSLYHSAWMEGALETAEKVVRLFS